MDQDHDQHESSECSSGCQSGWTMYLGQSFTNVSSKPEEEEEEEQEEEGQSMVSDASSGPPHFRDEDDRNFCSPPASALSKNDVKRRVDARKQPSSLLDDTASSPVFSKTTTYNAEDALEFSCGFSATHVKPTPPVNPASSARPAATTLPCVPFGMHFSEGM